VEKHNIRCTPAAVVASTLSWDVVRMHGTSRPTAQSPAQLEMNQKL